MLIGSGNTDTQLSGGNRGFESLLVYSFIAEENVMNQVAGDLELDAALEVAVKYCPDGYAKSYAKRGMEYRTHDKDWLSWQLHYLLSNAQSWRGEQARQTKAILRKHL